MLCVAISIGRDIWLSHSIAECFWNAWLHATVAMESARTSNSINISRPWPNRDNCVPEEAGFSSYSLSPRSVRRWRATRRTCYDGERRLISLYCGFGGREGGRCSGRFDPLIMVRLIKWTMIYNWTRWCKKKVTCSGTRSSGTNGWRLIRGCDWSGKSAAAFGLYQRGRPRCQIRFGG